MLYFGEEICCRQFHKWMLMKNLNFDWFKIFNLFKLKNIIYNLLPKSNAGVVFIIFPKKDLDNNLGAALPLLSLKCHHTNFVVCIK